MRTICRNEWVLAVRVAGVIEGGRKLGGQAELLVQLPDRQEAGVAGQLCLLRFNDNRLMIEEIERHLPIRLYDHLGPPWSGQVAFVQQLRRSRRFKNYRSHE